MGATTCADGAQFFGVRDDSEQIPAYKRKNGLSTGRQVRPDVKRWKHSSARFEHCIDGEMAARRILGSEKSIPIETQVKEQR